MSSPDTPRTGPEAWLHFAGVAGSGMSALAQFHADGGGRASGSDRAFDQGERLEIRDRLLGLGVQLVPQDGSFLELDAPEKPDALVVSTAVEDRVPDVAAARGAEVPVLHRSELLARYVADHRSIAVSGTSGKSTVTAMVFAILRAAGLEPGLITGGPVADLVAAGHLGNAWAPGTTAAGHRWLVIEADESDGSLVRYRPWCGLVLNLGLDHKPPAEIMAMFETFRTRVTGPLLVADLPALGPLQEGAGLFGVGPGPGLRATDVELRAAGVTFRCAGTRCELPHPGLHNVWNAVAAIAAAREAGVDPATAAAALREFGGVSRRFQAVGRAAGVEVIDDFAHNPDKIVAALGAARERAAGRVLAVFQPHGFGPTRFLREALVEAFSDSLRDDDVLWMPEIYFAGGTVTRDISAGDLVGDIAAAGRDARFVAERGEIPAAVAAEARPGDLVLVMGARDPSLTAFCGSILAALGTRPA